MAKSKSPKSAHSAVPPPPSSNSTTSHSLNLSTTASPPPQPVYSRIGSTTTISVPSDPPSGSPSNDSSSPTSSSQPPSQEPVVSAPPPSSTSPPPDSVSPPINNSPPPVTESPPPPLPDPPKSSPPPPVNPLPPPSQDPPAVTPTTPSPNPTAASPPPASSNQPSTSPPPRSDAPQISPPPTDPPPQNSPSSSSSQPSQTPTSPPGIPVQDSTPSPGSAIPTSSTTSPSTFTPPPPLSPDSQPSPNASANPLIPVSPATPSPPSPTEFQVPPSGIRTTNSKDTEKISTEVAVSIGIVLGFLLLGVIGIAVWCTIRTRKRVAGMPTSVNSSPKTDTSLLKAQRSPADAGTRTPSEYMYSPSEAGGMGSSRAWFTYDALVEATNGFSEENLLGEGGFGRVYKGQLPDGQEVAVKQLKIGGGQGEREFKAEVEIISRIHHRHLVSLAGYCISDSRRLLVYQYVPNNTLHFHLHGPDQPVMTWEARVKIAAGAARGLAYLHEDCLPRIIHRDIKSANILLDKNFEARVSDFGLAKLAEDANSHVTTRVMGTFGYMAPEYASSGKLTEKSDVFSFGVVLLELITGRKPVDTSQPLGQESLAEWARPKLSHALATEEFEDLVDPRLERNYVENEMFRAIEAAAACVRHSATKRPTMGQVVRAFESMISADITNGMRVGDSATYNNSAEQSAEIRLFQRMAFGDQDYSTDIYSQGSWPS